MQIFELHFNPKLKEDLIFDSFCYEPENLYEKRLGSLIMAGELKNALPQNIKLLDNFANFLKKQYYLTPIKLSPESSLKLGLKKANEFLENIAKAGDVSWLGNLNLGILCLKKFELNFTKVGEIKIFLLRSGEVIDIGRNLDNYEIEPYPLKIFGNIVSGKLTDGDVILILTKDLFSVFTEDSNYRSKKIQKPKKEKNQNKPDNLLEKLAKVSPFEEKKLKEILKSKEKELLKVAGVCLICVLTKEVWAETKKPKSFTFKKELEKFSPKQVFVSLITNFKKITQTFLKKLPQLNNLFKKPRKIEHLKIKPAKRKERVNWLKLPKLNIPSFSSLFLSLKKLKFKLNTTSRKNLIVLVVLIILLASGYFIFRKDEQTKQEKNATVLMTTKERISEAENFLKLKNEKKAFEILKEAYQTILPLTEKGNALQVEATTLKETLEKTLEKISKLEEISDPQVLFEFNQKEFIPQKAIYLGNNLYLFSPFYTNVFKLSTDGKNSTLEINQSFSEAARFNNSILFFQKPNQLFLLKNDTFGEPISLELPYQNFTPDTFSTYRSNLYFLDAKKGEIIKYPAPLESGKDFPQIWLNSDAQKVVNASSMTVDGAVWILNEDNTMAKYYTGNRQEKIALDLFPFPKNFSKIVALSEWLFILEPNQKRIIISTKTGQIVKQIYSEKFDNLKDLAVSDTGKTIWILSGVKIFQVKI